MECRMPVTVALHVTTILIVVALAGCTKQVTEEARSPIRFSYQNRIGSAIPIVAVAQGLFEKRGLNVVAVRFDSGPACAESLYTGAADIGTMGDTTAVIALSRGAPLRLVTSHASGEHRHRLIVAASSPYRSVRDLSGRRVGIKKGSSTYGGFLRYLDAQGMAAGAVQVIDLKPGTMPDALAAGSIQAFAASEPTPSLGELRGGRELATFGGLGNTYPVMTLVRERFARERPAELRQFLDALGDAERIIRDDRQSAVELVALATGLPPDLTARAMDRHVYRLDLGEAILASLREAATFLQQEGVIDVVPEFAAPAPVAAEERHATKAATR